VSLTADELYALLPAIYRQRDTDLGINGASGPLREIIEIIAGQFAVVDTQLDQLYDDTFIETCAEWVVPYIGDLVGYQPLSTAAVARLSPRAEVANLIRYRRWKGTVTILEQLASDVTGWSAVAVEFFSRLTTTQFMNHLRMDSLGTVDIRHADVAASAGTPFDRNSHSVEVRRIRNKRGRFNIPSIGVYVWRLSAFVNADNPSNAARIDDGKYTFDPLAADRALVNVPPLGRNPFTRSQPGDVQAPLRVRALAAAGPPFPFNVYDVTGALIPQAHVDICDLSAWNTPLGTPNLPAPYTVAVDPQLGRIWFPAGTVPAAQPILVTYGYTFSGPYGAGFHHRDLTGAATLFVQRAPASWQPDMTMIGAINTALAQTNKPVIGYADNVTDSVAETLIPLVAQQTIVVRAEDHRRPVFTGPVIVNLGAGVGQSATFVLDGLWCAGGIAVKGTGTLNLILRNCTIGPGPSGNAIDWTGASGTLTVQASLCGPIELNLTDVDASVLDSALDAGGTGALTAGNVSIVRSTIFGSVSVREITLIENTIITAVVASQRQQTGCVRFSWLPSGSTVPQRYRCQPDTAAQAAIDAAALNDPNLSQTQLTAIGDATAAQIVPQFTSTQRGDAAYAQLSVWCPSEISAGADDGGEMGIFHSLYTTLREANLLYRLDNNLRIGLEAGVLHAS
jgi:hypothetical protein